MPPVLMLTPNENKAIEQEIDPYIQALLLVTEMLHDIHQELHTMRIAMQEQIKYNSYHRNN